MDEEEGEGNPHVPQGDDLVSEDSKILGMGASDFQNLIKN